MTKLGLASLASLLSFFSCGAKNKELVAQEPANPIKSYSYSEHGSVAEPLCDFCVERVDDSVCKVIYYNRINGGFADERDTTTCPAALLHDIEAAVEKHKMNKYEKSYQSEYEVMDGDSWSMHIKYADGSKVYSGGYCAYPDDDGLIEIRDMMRERIKGI